MFSMPIEFKSDSRVASTFLRKLNEFEFVNLSRLRLEACLPVAAPALLQQLCVGHVGLDDMVEE